MRSTLQHYYDRKWRLYNLGDLSFSLRPLRMIFRQLRDGGDPRERASVLIRKHKRRIVQSLCGWSGERASKVDRVMSDLAHLCDEHRLYLRSDPTTTLVQISTYVSTLIVNRIHTLNYRLEK